MQFILGLLFVFGFIGICYCVVKTQFEKPDTDIEDCE